MSRAFQKKPHEMSEIDRMRERMREIHNMEEQVKNLKQMLALERTRNDRFSAKSNAYDWIREQELMLMTPEGVKYLTGEDLDAYVDAHRPPLQESWLNTMAAKMQQAIDTEALRALVDEAHVTDAYTYTTNGRMLYGTDRTNDD